MPDLGCSPNAARAFDFFVSKGLRDFQAAGIVGNLQQESAINPAGPAGDGGRANGIAQWHEPRWGALLAFAAARGQSPRSLDAQLEFVWHELETEPRWGLAQIQAAATIEEATIAFQDRFERCGDCRPQARISFARSVLYTCPAIRPPEPVPVAKKLRATAVVGAALGLVTLTAYGLYRAFRADPAPDPYRPPRPPGPPLRPQPTFRYRIPEP